MNITITREVPHTNLISIQQQKTTEAVDSFVGSDIFDDNEIMIRWIGLQFDWMSEWIQKDLSLNPISLKSGDAADFGTFEFRVPSDTRVGNHTLTIGVKYDIFVNSTFTVPAGIVIVGEEPNYVEVHIDWYTDKKYKSYTVEVHNIDEKLYKELNPIVFQQLTEAEEKTYLSWGAKDLLQQANSKYIEATSLTEQNRWSEAYEALQDTQSLLNRMPCEENNFIMLITGSIAVGITLTILVILFLRKE